MKDDNFEVLKAAAATFIAQVSANVSDVLSYGERRERAGIRILFRHPFDFVCANLSSFEFRSMSRMERAAINILTAVLRYRL